MIIGIVKWYSRENGYGIIMPNEGVPAVCAGTP